MLTSEAGHKAIVGFLVLLGLITGFFMGHFYGTGTLPILQSQAIMVPAATTVHLGDVQAVLEPLQEREYIEGYNCVDYAWEAMRLMRWKGQESLIVLLTLEPGPDHAILLVPTVDHGWVFLDPQCSCPIKPVVGGRYEGHKILAIDVLQFVTVPLEEFLDGSNES